MIDANDPVFSSRMLRKRAKETFTHQGLLALASPHGWLIFIPFEVSEDGMRIGDDAKISTLSYMLRSASDKFRQLSLDNK